MLPNFLDKFLCSPGSGTSNEANRQHDPHSRASLGCSANNPCTPHSHLHHKKNNPAVDIKRMVLSDFLCNLSQQTDITHKQGVVLALKKVDREKVATTFETVASIIGHF